MVKTTRKTYLVLDEVERVLHELDSRLSVHTDRQHADHAASQAVVEAER